jgi:hypothetical protein
MSNLNYVLIDGVPHLLTDSTGQLVATEGSSRCCCKCVYIKDDFEREEIGANWEIVSGTWSIEAGELKGSNSGRITHQTLHPKGTSNIIAHVRAKLPAAGATARLYIGDHYLEIEAAATGCGKMRLFDGGGQLGPEVRVPDLTTDTRHELRLCYDQGTQVLSGSVNEHRHHARGVTISGASLVGLGTGSTAGDYYFDDFEVAELRPSGYYYYDDCPCCTGNCESKTPSLDDCRWTDEGGGRKLWNASWSGLSPSCESDVTQRIVASFANLAFGDEAEVFLDLVDGSTHHSAKLTLNADASTPGTLKLFRNGVQIDSVGVTAQPGDHSLTLCFDQETLVAQYGGTRLEEDSSGNNGLLAAVALTSTQGTIAGATISYNLYEVACPDCVGTVTCTACTNNTAPERLKAIVGNAFPPIDICRDAVCSDVIGSHIMTYSGESAVSTVDLCKVGLFDPPSDYVFNVSALCSWVAPFVFYECNPPDASPSAHSRVSANIFKLTAGGFLIVGQIELSNGFPGTATNEFHIFYKVISAAELDCLNDLGVELEYVCTKVIKSGAGFGNLLCDPSAVTFKVSNV